ncbi:MAG: hypothetical protein IJ744_02380 [Lachnospiraceae bacterium]|nr:hypothetical protein [Lachnospiraceae bacterium]
MIFYRVYRYAPSATAFSVLCSLIGYGCVVGAISLIAGALIIPAILVGAIGAFFIIYLGHTVADKIAEKNGKKNIETKAKYARIYCGEHPEAYEYLRSINPDFAAKFTRDENGKIVKMK